LSDFTAFQSALLAKTGAHSWAGPALGEDFGQEQPDDIMEACFDDMLSGQARGGVRLSALAHSCRTNERVFGHKTLFCGAAICLCW